MYGTNNTVHAHSQYIIQHLQSVPAFPKMQLFESTDLLGNSRESQPIQRWKKSFIRDYLHPSQTHFSQPNRIGKNIKTTKVKMLSFFTWSTLSRIKSTFYKDFIWQHNALVPFLDYMDRSQVGTNCFTLALRRPSPTLSCAYMHSSRFDTRFMATLPSYRRKNYSQQCQCQFQGICGVTQL